MSRVVWVARPILLVISHVKFALSSQVIAVGLEVLSWNLEVWIDALDYVLLPIPAESVFMSLYIIDALHASALDSP